MMARPKGEEMEGTGLRFVGAPVLHTEGGAAVGVLVLRNGGPEVERPGRVTLRIGERVAEALLFADLPAGSTGRVPVNVPLDPPLAPGRSRGTIEVGDARGPVEVISHETASLLLHPAEILIIPESDEAESTHLVTVENRGNVPIALPARLGISLDHEDRLFDTIHQAIRARGKTGYEAVADHTTASLADTEVRPAMVYLAGAEKPVAPLETRVIEARVKLPRGLEPNRTYSGAVQAGGTLFGLQVETHRLRPPTTPRKRAKP